MIVLMITSACTAVVVLNMLYSIDASCSVVFNNDKVTWISKVLMQLVCKDIRCLNGETLL